MCSLAPNVVNQYLFLVSWFMIVVTIGLNVLNVLGSLFELAFYRSFYGWIRKINPGNAPKLTFPSDIMTIEFFGLGIQFLNRTAFRSAET